MFISEFVYVNEEMGEDIKTCGKLFSPCKTLREGVNKVKPNGKVYIQGQLTIDKTIMITKSINIHGVDSGGVLVAPSKSLNWKNYVFHAFKAITNVNVTFASLSFYKVGLIDTIGDVSLLSINISMCQFNGPLRAGYVSHIPYLIGWKTRVKILLRIQRSFFKHINPISPYAVIDTGTIEKSNFTYSDVMLKIAVNGRYGQYGNHARLSIRSCLFLSVHDEYKNLRIEFVGDVLDIVNISNCLFKAVGLFMTSGIITASNCLFLGNRRGLRQPSTIHFKGEVNIKYKLA